MTEFIVADIGMIEMLSIAAISVAFVLSIFGIYRRLSKSSSRRRYGLVLINLLASLALLGLILQPQLQTDQNLTVSLYTNINHSHIRCGWESDKNSFVLEFNPVETTVNETMAPSILYQSHRVKTAEQILLKYASINQLKIIGDGLTESQWQYFPDIKIDYQIPELINGIIQPQWSSSLGLGESLIFSGQLQSSFENVHLVKLIDPAGQVVAETSLLGAQFFYLSTEPKLAGNHQYKLEITDNQNRLISEQLIPVNVTTKSSTRILVIQSSPSFETKQLQNWAAENGAQFLLRSRISKNIYSTRSTNISKQQQNKNGALNLNRQLFDKFDLAIIDGRELMVMTKYEQEQLLLSISGGLGVLILADQDLLSLSKSEMPTILSGLEMNPLNQATEIIPYIVTQDLIAKPMAGSFVSLVGLSINPRRLIGSGQSNGAKGKIEILQSLIQSSQGDSLVAQRVHHSGRIAVSLLQQTHRLVTSGQKVNYSRLWHHLISQIARKEQRTQLKLNGARPIIFSKHRIEVCYSAPSTAQKVAVNLQAVNMNTSDTQSILMQTDPLLGDRSCGYFWPDQAGWYEIRDSRLLKASSNLFYVFEQSAWSAYQQHHKIESTKAKQAEFVENNIESLRFEKINPWIFWWVLVLSSSLIWIERKYNTTH